MKYNIVVRYLLAFLAFSAVFTSCIKEEVTPLGDGGQSLVKFMEGPENQLFFSPFNNVRNVDLFSLRRDVNSNATLRTSSAIKLKAAPELVEAYNEENDEVYEWLPDSLYTLVSNASIQRDGDGYTFNFGSGDFAKELSIQLNGAKWDIAHKYAVAFTITDPAGLVPVSSQKSIITFISVKNKYDGVYEVTGECIDANGLYMGDYGDPEAPRIIELATSTANSVVFFDQSWAYPNYIVLNISTGGAANTGIRPVYVFNTDTDQVTRIYNANNGQDAVVGAISKFNPEDRSLDIEWTIGRWHVIEHYKFLKER